MRSQPPPARLGKGSLLAPTVLAAVLAIHSFPLRAQAFADAKSARIDYAQTATVPRLSCDSMATYKGKEIVSTRSAVVPAAGAIPTFCRVTGTLAPEIAFEVSLPSRWNGRFYMIGNGGHAGESLEDPVRVAQRGRALQMGFAFAQTNTGHDAHQEPGASFILSNPQKAIDYAYRAVHLTAMTAKAIITTYYGIAINHSYWNSCSNGGRQGLIEAQRYPEDFDGLVVNAPWVDQTGFTLGALWNQKALSQARLTAGKLALLSDKVLAKCDAIDGLSDGVIDDPRQCDFDPTRDVPACAADTDDDSCLTAAQAQAIKAVYQGPQSGGKTLFPGYMPGSEAAVSPPSGSGAATSAWLNFIVAAQPDRKPADFNLAENTMRYLVLNPPDPNYDYRTFDFDHDPPLLARWGKLVNATETDLASFRRRGGKLLMTYGWADQVLQPLMGVTYYERAVKRNGPRTPEFFRLFMVPGMTHCSGGVGTDQFDAITAVIDWVEKNQPPDVLRASHIVDKKVVRTRPLCPYPQIARYQGQGSIDDASNFQCATP